MGDRRVLIVQSNAERYGSDLALASLTRPLIERGWQLTITVPGEGPTVRGLRDAGAEVVFVDPAPLRRTHGVRWLRYLLLDLPVAVWRLRRLARDRDLVHVNTSICLGAVIGGWAARRPVILHVRESYAGRERLWRAYGRLLRRATSAVVTISNDIAAEAVTAGLGDRTVVIHDGLEFGPPPDVVARDGPLVMVARINDWKGHLELVEAIRLLLTRGVTVSALLAGDVFPGAEAYRDRLVEAITDAGLGDQVQLLGFVDDVPGLLERASMLVMPSTRPEPFGLALIEAMAHGLACIATDAGGPRDIIRPGETGVLVPCRDTVALADAIEELWNDPAARERLGRAAAEDVRSRFSIEATVDRVDDIYRGSAPVTADAAVPGQPCLPTFLVIGAMKAGTTSLHRYLQSHPDVYLPDDKEPEFFSEEANWRRGVEWYGRLFTEGSTAVARGEASTGYTKLPRFPRAVERMAATVPGVRLVYVVREPVARMQSHYVHNVLGGLERRPIAEALTSGEHYLPVSRYWTQLSRYRDQFPDDQVLVVSAEDLRDRRAETVSGVLAFIGADPRLLPDGLDDEFHRSEGRRGLRAAARPLARSRVLAALRQRAPAPVIAIGRRVLAGSTSVAADIDADLAARLREALHDDTASLAEHLGDRAPLWARTHGVDQDESG